MEIHNGAILVKITLLWIGQLNNQNPSIILRLVTKGLVPFCSSVISKYVVST